MAIILDLQGLHNGLQFAGSLIRNQGTPAKRSGEGADYEGSL
jgi:hypothetical protein